MKDNIVNDFGKQDYIQFFRENGFNCFPIPQLKKEADYRYKASATEFNQPVNDDENYGIIPVKGKGNAIIDLDDKELYRKFAEDNIRNGYMVIETGKGWHIPVIGLSGNIRKIELFNYGLQPEKIIEIQGPDHYVVGAGSVVDHEKLKKLVTYTNKGSLKIWDGKRKDFHHLVDSLCKSLDVTGKKKDSRSSNLFLRKKFLKGEPPSKGQSNDYFYQAAIQCNSDGLSQQDALEKIRTVYDLWEKTTQFSGRPWKNIEDKLEEVYEKNLTNEKGRPKKPKGNFEVETAQVLLQERKLYSDVDTGEVFENVGGFLELINKTLQKPLQMLYPDMKQSEYNEIIFKLVGLSEDMPETNKNLYVFNNGVFDKTQGKLVETDEIADMGFKQFAYLGKSASNVPTKFKKILFDNVETYQHPRIKAGLRNIMLNYVDPRISNIYGLSGVGKSTPLEILVELLGPNYALSVELRQFLNDPFIRAKIKGKRLLVLQDLPKEFKDFHIIKTITGEKIKTERGFHQDVSSFDNKLKIWASSNYLATIPDEEKNAMYTRRLSLVHNKRKIPFKEDQEFAGKVIKEEGEKIISWILNFSDEECQYEDKTTVQKEWEGIASPELDYLIENYKPGEVDETGASSTGLMTLIDRCEEKTKCRIGIEEMTKTLKSLGYVVRNNVVKNITNKPIVKAEESQETF